MLLAHTVGQVAMSSYQGVARPLRRDHSLTISKTMRRRRSHHLPRPSLGHLVPDQAYLVPDQVYLVLNQVVHIPRIGPWQNHPLDPVDEDILVSGLGRHGHRPSRLDHGSSDLD